MAAMHHVRQGSGPPLVLLHGVGSEARVWGPVLDRLAGSRDVIAVDLPGFGSSAPLAGEPSIAALTDAVAEWFASAGLSHPHVAGNSMGGAIALELARRGAVASATAVSPAGFWTDRERRFCQLSLSNAVTAVRALGMPRVRSLTDTAPGRTALLGQIVARPGRVPPEEAARIAEAVVGAPSFAAALRAFDDYRFGRGHELRGVPVTVAWGRRDWLLIPREGRRVPRLLPHARMVWLERCGHVPMWDDPDAVARVLLEGSSR
jgi:pimeloyl-ACP methyl ester carboxylesterase